MVALARILLVGVVGDRLSDTLLVGENDRASGANVSEFDALAALDALSDGFFSVDAAWGFRFLNRAAEHRLRVERSTVLGASLWDAVPLFAGSEFERRARAAMQTRQEHWMVAPSVLLPGAHVEIRLFPLDGGLGVSFRDVTDRVQLETALRAGESQVRQLTDALPLLVSYVDRNERFQFNNLAYEQYAGRGRETLKGQRVQDVIGPANYAKVKPYVSRALAGERVSFEWRGRRLREEGEGDFRSDYIPRLDEAGRPDGFYVLFTEITEQKAIQQRLEQLNSDLEAAVGERTAALSEALAQLREQMAERQKAEAALAEAQKMEAVGQLTGGLAHDFNNLLTVIQSSTDLLSRKLDDPERRERYLAAIAEAAQKAAALTNQLLVFARRQPLQQEVFDVGERTRELSVLIASTLGARYRVEVAVDPGETWCVEADRNQYETAILNMALNARDAMPDGGRLNIAVGPAAEAGFIAVRVADTGAGIPAKALPRLFEPFFTTKAVGKGTGLGLSQVYGFARHSGGEIRAESVEGEGATFILTLPRSQKAPSVRVPSCSPDENRPGGRVLLVEDNPAVREFAGQLLEELGWRAHPAPDASSALAEVRADPAAYDLVFTDVVMPGEMSGLDLAKEIREIAPQLPVVLASGYSHVLAQEGSLGFPLLQKPYSLEKLAEALRAAVRS